MRTLLYLLYGSNPKYQLELTYSVLSADRFLRKDPAGIRMVLASNAQNLRRDLPVELLEIDPAVLSDWQGGEIYKHAAKPNILHHCLQRFSATTILVDSDTIFHEHPKNLFDLIGPGRSLMHKREWLLGENSDRPHWEMMVKRCGGEAAGYRVDLDSVMYNSGILGLHPNDAPLMDDIKKSMWALQKASSMASVEQLAASLVLSSRTELSTCPDTVEHYWGQSRAYYHYQLARMFPEVQNGHGIKGSRKLASLRKRPQPRAIDVMAARLKRAFRRNDGEYAYAFLAYRSALSARGDAELANVWAEIALEMLNWGVSKPRLETVNDFIRFGSETLDGLDWMTPELRSRWHAFWLRWSRGEMSLKVRSSGGDSAPP